MAEPQHADSEAQALERRFGSFLGHPKGLTFLFFAEMWERFSFYGMRALLFPFMIESLGFTNPRAGAVYGLYTGGAYLTGILGGYVSDRVMGQRRAMMLGGAMMVVGHFAMAWPTGQLFFSALTLIAVGTGFFKPNSASMVGKLYHLQDPRRERAFGLYYLGVNLGSLSAVLICGYLGQAIGWHAGFAAAGVGMTFGLMVFAAGQAHFGSLGAVASAPLAAKRRGQTPAPEPLSQIERERIWAVLLLGVLGNIAFWATFEQAGSSLNLFAAQSTRLDIMGWLLPAAWLQAANPAFIILLTPLFTILWQRLSETGKEPSTVAKFSGALGLVALGFGVMACAGRLVDSGLQVSVLWLVGTYFLHTLGELMIAPVGLSMVSRLAPPRYGSLLMSLWFATMAVADWLGGALAGEYSATPKVDFFANLMLIAAVACLLLFCLRRPLIRLMHAPAAAN